MNKIFPFTGIIGQEKMKNALVWNLINPLIGGVLICGEKGTGKSTIVRSLENLYLDDEVINLPLNITEDRLIGSISLNSTIERGEKSIDYGLLKKADKNILYIDEVNLLSDYIVNVLLNVSQSKVNIIEREGISYSHSSNFILVGSMNPEEGKIRGQFLDRFGLFVETEGLSNILDRSELIKRNLEFEKNPEKFHEEYKFKEEHLSYKILRARKNLNNVNIPENIIKLSVEISKNTNCEGHRAEIIMIETARAIVAFDDRDVINIEDMQLAAEYVLPHRIKTNSVENKNGSSKDETSTDNIDRNNKNEKCEENKEVENISDERFENVETNSSNINLPSIEKKEKLDEIGEIFSVKKWLYYDSRKIVNKGNGRRSLVKTSLNQGRYIRALRKKSDSRHIAFDATFRSAALKQKYRHRDGIAFVIEKEDIRFKYREKRTGNSILFVVDASGSMGANQRMKAVKGAIYSLLNEAYQKRDKVGLVSFRKDKSELLLDITRSIDLAKKKLEHLPTGGRTPLGDGLNMGKKLLSNELYKNKNTLAVLVLITDGRANYSKYEKNPLEEAYSICDELKNMDFKTVVIDTESGFIELGIAKKLADRMNADYFKIQDIKSEELVGIISKI